MVTVLPSRSSMSSWARRERARERASREMPVASAISWRESEGSKTTPRLVTRPSSVARFRSMRATLCGALRKTRSPTRSSSSRARAAGTRGRRGVSRGGSGAGQAALQRCGAAGEAAHDGEEVITEHGVEHAVGKRRGALALRAALEGGAEAHDRAGADDAEAAAGRARRPARGGGADAHDRAVADDAEDLVARLRTARGAVELRPPLAHEVHGP